LNDTPDGQGAPGSPEYDPGGQVRQRIAQEGVDHGSDEQRVDAPLQVTASRSRSGLQSAAHVRAALNEWSRRGAGTRPYILERARMPVVLRVADSVCFPPKADITLSGRWLRQYARRSEKGEWPLVP
jgi:hypothetical protein